MRLCWYCYDCPYSEEAMRMADREGILIVDEIPAVGLSHEDGFVIQRLLRGGQSVTLEMRLANQTAPAQLSHVIGEVPGRRDDAIIVVGAHYDGHDISQGAGDPASGAVTVMEIARILSLVKDQLERRVRVVTFGAEEIGLFGSYAYVAQHEAELDRCRFMLNLDAAGGAGIRQPRILPLGNPAFLCGDDPFRGDLFRGHVLLRARGSPGRG